MTRNDFIAEMLIRGTGPALTNIGWAKNVADVMEKEGVAPWVDEKFIKIYDLIHSDTTNEESIAPPIPYGYVFSHCSEMTDLESKTDFYRYYYKPIGKAS